MRLQIFDANLNDLIQLKDLSEFALLYKLMLRYHDREIYTFVGAVLVAVNPYEVLPLFSEEVIMQYVEHQEDERKLDPHVFGVARLAYRKLLETGTNQAFLVSGESGAGKTETTKLVLKVSDRQLGTHASLYAHRWTRQKLTWLLCPCACLHTAVFDTSKWTGASSESGCACERPERRPVNDAEHHSPYG